MKSIKVQITIDMEYDEKEWKKKLLLSWIENKCWETLIESGGDTVYLSENTFKVKEIV